MKKILITGAHSYIGTSFERYITESYADEYAIDTVDMTVDTWRETDFSGYDCVFHVAGIAHQRETRENAHLYDLVNRDLAVETAQKAKSAGVKQFIFLSTMSVYGMHTGVITKSTAPCPKSRYGMSKWQAEQMIAPMHSEDFRVCILRPPMVYGKDCKGNFRTVVKLVRKSPVFPKVKNERSMIYVDNLSSFVRLAIDRDLSGVYFPQNCAYVSTVEMAKGIASAMDKRMLLGPITGWGVALLRLFVPMAKKAFGTLIYRDTEDFDFSYVRVDNATSFSLSI